MRYFRVARFFLVKHTKPGKIYHIGNRKIPILNDKTIDQRAVKYTKLPKIFIPTLSFARPSKIYPNFGLKTCPLATLRCLNVAKESQKYLVACE
jgi:hypothetical protein